MSQGPRCGNHTHYFSHCIKYHCLDSQTSVLSVSRASYSFQGSPSLERVAVSFSQDVLPRDWTWISELVTILLPSEPSRKPLYGQSYWEKCKTKPSSIQDGRASSLFLLLSIAYLSREHIYPLGLTTDSGLHSHTIPTPTTGTHRYTKAETKINVSVLA